MNVLLRISIVMGGLILMTRTAKAPRSSRNGLVRFSNDDSYSINTERYSRTKKRQEQKQAMFWPNQPQSDPNQNEEDEDDNSDEDEDEGSDYNEFEDLKPRFPARNLKRHRSRANAEYLDYRLNQMSQIKRAPSVRKTNQHFEGRKEMMHTYFMNTTSFVHGDTFLGLGRTTSGIVFLYFATLYCVYILSTTLLLFQRRKDPSLSKFPLWMSHFIPAGMNALIVVLGFTRHMFRAKYPCFIVLWTYGLLAPMYIVMIFEARSLNLIFEYHWNKRMQALLQVSEPRPLDGDQNAPVIVLDKSTKKPDKNQLTSKEDWFWIKKNGMIATIIGIFIFQFGMTLAIQIFSPYYRIWPKMVVYRCSGYLETILPVIALEMYLFIIPCYLFIQLKRINDSYGVRKDLYNSLTHSAWIFLLFSIVRHVFFIGKFIGYVPTGFAVFFIFGILHYHTVCAPLLRIYVWQWSRSRVKRHVKKLLIMKRRIDSIIFPRIFRIRIDKKRSLKSNNDNNGILKAPEPIKASRNGELRQRPRVKNSNNNDTSPLTVSPADSRLEYAASPAASMSPIIPPELKPPTFNQVLQDEVLCELFERYTLLEFSRENLLFYRAVCSLRSTVSSLPQGAAQIFLVEKCRSLASQFIHINSPAEINIPGPVRKRIEDRLAELDVDLTLFDEAQREVFRLMQNWSYPRFIRTLPEAEIRRFNRKARRNSTTHLDPNLAHFAAGSQNSTENSSSTTAAVPISNSLSSHSQNNSRAFAANDLLATSACSLTLPLNIAEVSLSSSL